ncbi:MAG: hypothetical protein AVDCRST_MAG56-4035 [uncultured Cytophagales bacterium]|uniref:Uncharacterized protein n=1 Tax=uncultured Cytophagales bacterium TaxID=158755 RepID=A0A6J4JQB8_9SPHI|nr:MAG: hypothetical protein AVDCRST_MAG56-4035 [uncultured Cytophagales bacterium]
MPQGGFLAYVGGRKGVLADLAEEREFSVILREEKGFLADYRG